MNESTIDSLVLDEGLDDMVALVYVWQIVARVEGLDLDDRDALIVPTLAAICRLLKAEVVIAGSVVTGENGLLEVRSWELTPAETSRRIESAWREEDDRWNESWLVWLELTDRGRTLAQARRGGEGEPSV